MIYIRKSFEFFMGFVWEKCGEAFLLENRIRYEMQTYWLGYPK